MAPVSGAQGKSHALTHSWAFPVVHCECPYFTDVVEADNLAAVWGMVILNTIPCPLHVASQCAPTSWWQVGHRRHRKKMTLTLMPLWSPLLASSFGLAFCSPSDPAPSTQCPSGHQICLFLLQVNLQPSPDQFHWCHPWLQRCRDWDPKRLDGKSQGSPSHMHGPSQCAQL